RRQKVRAIIASAESVVRGAAGGPPPRSDIPRDRGFPTEEGWLARLREAPGALTPPPTPGGPLLSAYAPHAQRDAPALLAAPEERRFVRESLRVDMAVSFERGRANQPMRRRPRPFFAVVEQVEGDRACGRAARRTRPCALARRTVAPRLSRRRA